MPYYVYMLANRKDGTLCVGLTDDLRRRMRDCRRRVAGSGRGYNVTRLVRFESFDDPHLAAQREKNLRRWRRAWKVALIEEDNPDWRDLYPDLVC